MKNRNDFRNFAAQNTSTKKEKNKPRNAINKQLEYKEKEKDDNQIQLGKFFYSLAALTYAGGVLAVFVEYDERKSNILFLGLLVTTALGYLGWRLVKKGNIKR